MKIVKEYYENGNINHMSKYNSKGRCHSDTGPACINYTVKGAIKTKVYYFYGKSHRINGPNQTGIDADKYGGVPWIICGVCISEWIQTGDF